MVKDKFVKSFQTCYNTENGHFGLKVTSDAQVLDMDGNKKPIPKS